MIFTSKDQIWPLYEEDRSYFERVPFPDLSEALIEGKGVIVSKDIAVPSYWSLNGAAVVIAAGVDTQRKLTSRGIKVDGSFNGAGERHGFQQISSNPDWRSLRWVKLTHSDAVNWSSIPCIATYKLIPTKFSEDLSEKKYFYWRSGSLFLAALKQFPSIVESYHACGGGNTLDLISEYVDKNKITVFSTHEAWRERFSFSEGAELRA